MPVKSDESGDGTFDNEDQGSQSPSRTSDSGQSDQDYVRGGRGRKDEVGRSGIYPASSPDAPADADIRGQDDLGHVSPTKEDLMVIQNDSPGGD
jgi:hypothetical protein